MRYGTAATILLALLAGSYFFIGAPGSPDQVYVQDVAPGTNKAVLTFTDGSTMGLSSAHEGIIIADDEIKYVDGSGISDNRQQPPDNKQLMSLAIPKGGQYRIVLTDGTKVWLNAASVLTYPAAFSRDDRIVEIVGEGYFEVAEDKKKPFKVISNGLEIDVLGTAFNISAYPEEEVSATLVSGAVKVSTGHSATVGDQQPVMLRPGYEAIHAGNRLYTRKAHLPAAIGWKDGLFVFSGTELRQAMQQLSRWYNIEIEYKGDVPTTYFSGEIEKSNPLSAVLEILKVSGLNFKIEQGMPVSKLIIIP